MEDTQDTNIERMTSFIQLEAQEKANEIRIKSIEDYNTEKAKLVRAETEDIEANYETKLKELEIEFITKIGEIKNKYNMEFHKKKAEIARDFMILVQEECKKKPLSKEMAEECFDRVDDSELYAYCLKSDKDVVKAIIKERKLDCEIKEMDVNNIGGIIVESRNGETVCDNSYLKRCEVVRERYFCEIANELFK
ncbi:V-ATPase V1 sector subunit E [Conglomerata obtusa]